MRRVINRGRKNSARFATRRPESLESRLLLSADSLSGMTASPVAIIRTLTPAQVAAIPSGYTLNIPSVTVQGGNSPDLSGGYTPAQIRHAYGIDQLSETGAGQTIAIVDAYDDPSIASDLNAFDQQFGLPAANFVKETPQGLPTVDAGWDGEISLDVEWAHAIAPAARIMLVETMDSSGSALDAGVQYAYNQGASQISMSWGGGEYSTESSDDSLFDHPGTSFFASAGDSPSEVISPSISPYVTSVGGTALSLDSSGDKLSESAWSSGGGGPSLYEAEPAFQQGFYTSSVRGTPDVAYNADPNTGVYVDDGGSFIVVGGTSAGSPQWAGLAALANQGRATAGEAPLGTGQPYGTNSVLYDLAGKTSYVNASHDFFDVTTGSNGHPATTGYDLATGLGSPIANNLIPDLINSFSAKLPTIVNPAAATPNPVLTKSTQLSVLAADASGESTLTYTWTTTSAPAGAPAPTFGTNGTNAAKHDTATFYEAGTYSFQVRASDPNGLSVTSSVSVQVNSVATSLGILPTTSQLSANQTEQFTAPGLDQFGNPISGSSSSTLTWTLVSGGGTLTQSGLYTAPAVGTIATVSVSSGGLRNSATVYVLSNPWVQTDVGSPSVGGDAADNGSGTFTLFGAGTGITGASDQFQYAYLPLSGNSTIEAQVASGRNTGNAAEAGVTFRNDTTAGSANVTIAISPLNGLVFSYRSQANGSTASSITPRVTAGDYVKLVRVGNIFTGYYSTNGTTWTSVGAVSVAMGSTADGGLAVTSGNASTLNPAIFNHVLGDSSVAVVVAAAANPNPVTTTKTTLSVLGGDGAGESALNYTWSTTSSPAGAVAPTFATNGTNSSKSDVVTFSKAGTYTLMVTLSNALGYSTTSSVVVNVVATQTTVALTPLTIGVFEGGDGPIHRRRLRSVRPQDAEAADVHLLDGCGRGRRQGLLHGALHRPDQPHGH